MAESKTSFSMRSEALLARAAEALSAGRIDQAERDVRGALALAPADVRVLQLAARVAQRQGRHAEVVALLRRALTARPDDAALLNNLAIGLEAIGDDEGALAAFRRASELLPRHAGLKANLGKRLVDSGRVDEGVAALEAAIATDPALDAPRFTLAYAHRIAGRIGESARTLRAILDRQPHDGDAWLAIVELDAGIDAADIETMRAALAAPDIGGRSRSALLFAIARALDAAGRFDEAAESLREANASVRRIEPWDAVAAHERWRRLEDACAESPSGAACDRGSEVVFIAGLPRSGSTLIEQILASHPDVHGAGELPDLPRAIESALRRDGARSLEAWARDATDSDWIGVGEDYLERTARHRAHAPRSTDKLPSNWRLIDVIRRMLPGARIVLTRRDPAETALACFFRLFAPRAQSFSYDLADIGAFIADFERSAARHAASAAVRVQDYEALTRDPRYEIASLLEFCGLAPDPACYAFHETDRAVRTQSAAQVRRPLAAAPLRAPNYEALLEPFRVAFDSARSRA